MWDIREAAELHDEVQAFADATPAAGEFMATGSLYRYRVWGVIR